jgi:hypothetical protein
LADAVGGLAVGSFGGYWSQSIQIRLRTDDAPNQFALDALIKARVCPRRSKRHSAAH